MHVLQWNDYKIKHIHTWTKLFPLTNYNTKLYTLYLLWGDSVVWGETIIYLVWRYPTLARSELPGWWN